MSGLGESANVGERIVVTVTSGINVSVFSRVYSSNQKNEEKRGGSGSNNWGSAKDEVRSVYFCILHIFLLRAKLYLEEKVIFFFLVIRVSFGVLSETEQPAAPETTTEGGEETAPAGSENK